jgi:membrane protein implicated in regulation of membrane protease activity
MLNVTQLIIFLVISGIAAALIIYLLIEESDIVDMPLIPISIIICVFGAIGAIMTLMEIVLYLILIVAFVVCAALFGVIYYALKMLITKPEELKQYIGKKAITEIPIDPTSTGRIRLLETTESEEFPAKSNMNIAKNTEVLIEKFVGSYAFVIPLPSTLKSKRHSIKCPKCKTTIEVGDEETFCPNCGESFEK